jgi:predicted pyridoxine 5'-phosphate oxidase superfamily flavin-nucleotide-binding protein
MENYARLMFTQAVQDLQEAEGTKLKFETFYPHRTQKSLSEDDIAFIKQRNSFYIASVNSDGWPYVQHRGGARGFIHVAGPTQIACADYLGNKQFISMGNLQHDPRVSIFFMDYLNRRRLKIQGKATLIAAKDADDALVAQLDQRAAPAERVLQIDIVAMDWNCPKYIPTQIPEDMIEQIFGPEIQKLRSENEALREEIARLTENHN